MAALDTIGALGVHPVGVPENVFVHYLEPIAAAGARPYSSTRSRRSRR